MEIASQITLDLPVILMWIRRSNLRGFSGQLNVDRSAPTCPIEAFAVRIISLLSIYLLSFLKYSLILLSLRGAVILFKVGEGLSSYQLAISPGKFMDGCSGDAATDAS
jgi:hypothetical protein